MGVCLTPRFSLPSAASEHNRLLRCALCRCSAPRRQHSERARELCVHGCKLLAVRSRDSEEFQVTRVHV